MLLAAAVFFLGSVSRLEESRRREGRQQLEITLQRIAVSCYASEGFYPPDISYMQQHYGLRFDEESYVIHYQLTASNWMPEITVLERSP